jgi:hypothetical protein
MEKNNNVYYVNKATTIKKSMLFILDVDYLLPLLKYSILLFSLYLLLYSLFSFEIKSYFFIDKKKIKYIVSLIFCYFYINIIF